MQATLRLGVVLALGLALALADLVLSATGLHGRAWYSQPSTFVPALAGAIIGLRSAGSYREWFAAGARTVALAWGLATLFSVIATGLFAYLYNRQFGARELFGFARLAALHFLVGAVAAVMALAIFGALKHALTSEAA